MDQESSVGGGEKICFGLKKRKVQNEIWVGASARPLHEERQMPQKHKGYYAWLKKKKRPSKDDVRLADGYLNMDLEGNSGW